MLREEVKQKGNSNPIDEAPFFEKKYRHELFPFLYML